MATKRKTLENFLVKHNQNLVQMVHGWPSTKAASIILIGWKTWLPGGLSSYVNIGKTLKILLSENHKA